MSAAEIARNISLITPGNSVSVLTDNAIYFDSLSPFEDLPRVKDYLARNGWDAESFACTDADCSFALTETIDSTMSDANSEHCPAFVFVLRRDADIDYVVQSVLNFYVGGECLFVIIRDVSVLC